MRWVQNSIQCISTTITPSQFVLDDPEIVSALVYLFVCLFVCLFVFGIVSLFLCAILQLSVTVTPGLPPLLTNESYRCQFADREGLRVITVDAAEVTPNTVHQCNITGRIPTFTGVQLGKMNYTCSCSFELLQHIRLLAHYKTFHEYHSTVDGTCTHAVSTYTKSQ